MWDARKAELDFMVEKCDHLSRENDREDVIEELDSKTEGDLSKVRRAGALYKLDSPY